VRSRPAAGAEHAFREVGYLAGTDDERLADINTALRDDDVRAIFTTRGGKGSYRIAERLDFDGARRDPKFLIGFSDITILHLAPDNPLSVNPIADCERGRR
jgi:muramoyltetrapeptide carboxypeptidase